MKGDKASLYVNANQLRHITSIIGERKTNPNTGQFEIKVTEQELSDIMKKWQDDCDNTSIHKSFKYYLQSVGHNIYNWEAAK